MVVFKIPNADQVRQSEYQIKTDSTNFVFVGKIE